MTCGNITTGGCDNPDLGHSGPCTWDHETPEQRAERVKRNRRKSDKRRAKQRKQRIEALKQRGGLPGGQAPARDSVQEIQLGLVKENADLTARLAAAEKENAALTARLTATEGLHRLAAVERLHKNWGDILSDGFYCPSESCWAADGCDHTEGFHHAWHDLGKVLNAE